MIDDCDPYKSSFFQQVIFLPSIRQWCTFSCHLSSGFDKAEGGLHCSVAVPIIHDWLAYLKRWVRLYVKERQVLCCAQCNIYVVAIFPYLR